MHGWREKVLESTHLMLSMCNSGSQARPSKYIQVVDWVTQVGSIHKHPLLFHLLTLCNSWKKLVVCPHAVEHLIPRWQHCFERCGTSRKYCISGELRPLGYGNIYLALFSGSSVSWFAEVGGALLPHGLHPAFSTMTDRGCESNKTVLF